MENVLILHIGTPKTGTTVIQDFLGTNSERIEQYGWCYPNFKLMFPKMKAHWSGKYKNGDFLYEGWRTVNIHSESWENIWEVLLEKLKHSNVILSAEELFEWDTNYVIQEVKNKYDNVKLLVYLRRQDEYVESRWNQGVKNEEVCLDTKFDEYVANLPDEYNHIYESLFYWDKLEQLKQIVGRDNIIVRVYEKEQYLGARKNIVSDFLNAIGITEDLQNRENEKRLNVRLGAKILEIKRVFNTILRERSEQEKKYYSDFFRQLSLVSNDNNEKRMAYFTPEKRVEFYKQFEKQNELVAKEYLCRNDGMLFCDNKMDYPQAIGFLTTSEEEIIKAFAYFMVEQNTKVNTQITQLQIQNKMLVQNYIMLLKKEKKLVYFGAGQRCENMLVNYQMPVDFILDNDIQKVSGKIGAVEIKSPLSIVNWSEYFIAITCFQTEEIEKQLNGYGLIKGRDYILLKDLL